MNIYIFGEVHKICDFVAEFNKQLKLNSRRFFKLSSVNSIALCRLCKHGGRKFCEGFYLEFITYGNEGFGKLFVCSGCTHYKPKDIIKVIYKGVLI